MSDPAYADASIQSLVDADASAGDDDKVFELYIADSVTMTSPEHLLLAVDLAEEPGRVFRLPVRWWGEVAGNLFLANMNFSEFAEAGGDSGTFRGFAGPGAITT